MLFKNILCFFLCVIIVAMGCHAEEPSPLIIEQKDLKKINAVQLKLSNGMTFCLKPTDSESNEVFFKLSALGGYASANYKKFFSGKLADRIALESGIGNMSSDQFSVFLYKNALEFILEITPFSRTIEGEGLESSVEAFLQSVNMVFTEQHLTEEGFNEAIILTKNIIEKLRNDSDSAYEEAFLRVNTQNYRFLRPLTVEDLSKVNLEQAKSSFHRGFSDPSDFFCVITGNFDVEKVIMLIKKYIAPIPKPEIGSRLEKPFSVPFPPGITETVIKIPTLPNCLTHVTFPLQVVVNEQNINEIAFMCQIIEGRLRNQITNKMDLSYGVDVSYEFPIYPFLNNPWISIRYRCEDQKICQLKEIVLAELRRLQMNGASADELATIKKLEKGSQEFWLKDDFYWVSMLSNYYLWGWDPEKIDQENTAIYSLGLQSLNALLKRAISLNNYSVITATGQKH